MHMVLPGPGSPKREYCVLSSFLVLLTIFTTPSQLTAQTYHYEAIPGRLVGILPQDWSVENLTRLRLEYGFSGVYIHATQDLYEAAITAGFPPASIMAGLWGDEYESFVTSIHAGFYYIDEPAEHDCYGQPSGTRFYSPEELAARTHYIHYYRPGSRMVISGYKRCSHNLLAATNADVFMFSSYQHWSSTGLPVCHVNMGYADEWEAPWISGGSDQRSDWTDFREELGGRFAMSWIHGGGDEYDQLFGHATNLGLEGVWIYNGSPPGPARLEEICTAAAKYGWMRRVEGPPLPVQLSAFAGTQQGDAKVRLQWETASEVNAYGFIIERREKEGTPFAALDGGFVPAHGTTVEPHSYEFVDRTVAPGRHWYRLRMVDLDGSYDYSEEIAIDLSGNPDPPALAEKWILLESYPNPFNPSTTVRVQLTQSTEVRLGVYSILGEEVARLLDRTLEAGQHEVVWDAGRASSGVYFCRLFTPGGISELRVVLLR